MAFTSKRSSCRTPAFSPSGICPATSATSPRTSTFSAERIYDLSRHVQPARDEGAASRSRALLAGAHQGEIAVRRHRSPSRSQSTSTSHCMHVLVATRGDLLVKRNGGGGGDAANSEADEILQTRFRRRRSPSPVARRQSVETLLGTSQRENASGILIRFLFRVHVLIISFFLVWSSHSASVRRTGNDFAPVASTLLRVSRSAVARLRGARRERSQSSRRSRETESRHEIPQRQRRREKRRKNRRTLLEMSLFLFF